jgi:hypothetical protein
MVAMGGGFNEFSSCILEGSEAHGEEGDMHKMRLIVVINDHSTAYHRKNRTRISNLGRRSEN